MHQIRTQDRNILLEPGQHRLADPKCLHRFLVGTGKKVLVMRRRQAEHVANP